MKKALYLACFLAIVSALAGGLLAAVNEVTSVKIKDNALASVKESLNKIFPDSTYTEITDYVDESKLVTGVYEAEGDGYLFMVEPTGFKDIIKFVIGIDNNSTYVGYDVISNSETSGLGSKVAEDDFRKGVIGKTTGDSVSTISGATISSNAVIKGIDAAKAVYASLTGNAAPAPKPETPKPEEKPAEKATVIEKTVEGTKTTVKVESKGFEGNNAYTVVIDSETKEVVSVVMDSFKDTVGIGDQVNEAYLKGFAGLKSEEEIAKVDVVSGATYTSNSAIEAVKAAYEAAFSVEDGIQDDNMAVDPAKDTVTVKSTDKTVTTYTAKAQGFAGENEFEVAIDTAKNEVVSVKMTTFVDTAGIGDQVNEAYLANFAGLKSEEEISKVDVVSGATYTSNSAIEAVRAAFAASQK